MKIAYNPKKAVVVTATTAANNDILFDLNARKVWAKGLRMGADWEDISNKPSSLKNPEAIKFRDINGAEVSYDGSIAKDLMAGTYIAKLPYGFSSFTSEPTWGNVIGSSIASWNDSTEGSIDFRKDNPFSGKLSIKVNGRVYVNEGINPVLSAEFNNGFWGIRTPDGGNDWIRTPNTGLLPYMQGNAGSGHSSLGTSEWYFSTAYIDQVYGRLRGNADTATDADTLDGEHASSFVRAGSYESSNLNFLDTYSFIRSVNSTVARTSPGGYTGWYNVIQAVHKNGLEDGSEYIGQIALGMTTNLNKMFYRIKYRDSWYAWHEVLTTNTGLLRYSRNNVNISSSKCSLIPPSLLEWTIGYPRLYDPEFSDGNNDVQVYNNADNEVVTVKRTRNYYTGNSSNWVLRVVSDSNAADPNYGGWCVPTQTKTGKIYTCLFRANIPSEVEIEFNTNSIGNGGQWSWLTDNIGTGKWTWYAVQVYCGSSGSTTFYFSAKSPCIWYLSYVNVIENNRTSYAGLRSVYSDYLKQNTSLVYGRNELQYFNINTTTTSGIENATPMADWYHILRMNHANSTGYFVDLAIPFNNNRIQFRRITAGSDNGWRRVITEEPDHDVILRDSNEEGNVGIGTNNPTQKLDVLGNIRAAGQIVREALSVNWYKGREGALLRETSISGYHALWSLKTTSGSWEFGEYSNQGNDWNNIPLLTYITDSNFNSENNSPTYQIKFPLASGTVALTSDILSPINCYWANVKISTTSSTTTSPTVSALTATNSIRMGDIYLQNWNEINTSTSDLYFNYRGTYNISMCHGGGSVVIGPMVGNIGDNKLYVNGATTFNGLVTNNGGILPAAYDVNKNNTNCYVWGDAMSTGVTAITDALDPNYVTVNYSQDNGTTWIKYPLSNQDKLYNQIKFNLYANNGGYMSVQLGQGRIPDSNGTSSLSQVQKNQLMVTFEIPDSLYSALCWASVDIGNGIKTVCTVEIIAENGTIKNTFTKTMQGWNRLNYINFWGTNDSIINIGNNQARFVRFKFKHDASNTTIRNASIRKIRLFSFTNYNIDTDDFRSVMGNTGHLYKYDKDLNATFPKAINCNTLNITDSIIVDNISIQSKKSGATLAELDNSDTLNIYNKVFFSSGLCVGSVEPGLSSNITTDDTSALIGVVPQSQFTFTFKRAVDGQLLFLKLQKVIGTNNKVQCATQNCSVIRAADFETHIGKNTTKEIFGDGKSRIFIYQASYQQWLEFYCG